MALNPQQQVDIGHAEAAPVAHRFAGLPRNWRRNRWLSANNRYATDTVRKISADARPGGPGIRHAALSNYIAASSVIHCMDGWSYLARALEAQLLGDADSVRHLAYYAELRAAMSLLAGAGIGVFRNKHFVVRADLRCQRITGESGTHAFVWDALESWGQRTEATDLILGVIKPGGRDLSEWMQHFAPTAGGAFRGIIATHWLREWGLDLQRLASDHIARNESSYRPTYITPRVRPTLNDTLEFLQEFWRSNEPSLLNPFRILDRYLLRNSLAFAFKNSHGGMAPHRRSARFRRLVVPMLHNMLPTPGDYSQLEWERHLDFAVPIPELPILRYANSTDDVTSPFHHMQVAARALILLRVATGATRKLIQTIQPVDLAHLSFWWRPIGELRGLWETGATPPPFIDLWQEIDASLIDLATWRANGGASTRNMFATINEVARWLTSCERMGLWGLGL